MSQPSPEEVRYGQPRVPQPRGHSEEPSPGRYAHYADRRALDPTDPNFQTAAMPENVSVGDCLRLSEKNNKILLKKLIGAMHLSPVRRAQTMVRVTEDMEQMSARALSAIQVMERKHERGTRQEEERNVVRVVVGF